MARLRMICPLFRWQLQSVMVIGLTRFGGAHDSAAAAPAGIAASSAVAAIRPTTSNAVARPFTAMLGSYESRLDAENGRTWAEFGSPSRSDERPVPGRMGAGLLITGTDVTQTCDPQRHIVAAGRAAGNNRP